MFIRILELFDGRALIIECAMVARLIRDSVAILRPRAFQHDVAIRHVELAIGDSGLGRTIICHTPAAERPAVNTGIACNGYGSVFFILRIIRGKLRAHRNIADVLIRHRIFRCFAVYAGDVEVEGLVGVAVLEFKGGILVQGICVVLRYLAERHLVCKRVGGRL